MIKAISNYIQTKSLLAPGQTIVIGLSGGPDSVFLSHLLCNLRTEYNLTLIAAHLDHQWRVDSAQDVEFCRSLCAKFDVQFVDGKASEFAGTVKSNGSKEELGRKLRRLFFQQVAEVYGASAIALGHHLQDQQETFFIRMLRGTTLTGLTSMKPKDGLYIRPLLQTSKADIVAYLQQHNIPYLTDPTNESPEFLRNRIRAQVIPALKGCDDRFDTNFLRMLNHLQESEELLETIAQEKLLECVLNSALDHKKLLALEPQLCKRVLLLWLVQNKVPFVPTEKFLDELLRFMSQPRDGEHRVHEQWMLKKHKEKVAIEYR
jgi:tRNA(Ile)-lysidine synthase